MAAFELVAEPRAVPVARARVLAALADEPVDRSAVALAVTEAVANVVMHAYRFQRRPGRFSVTVERAADGVAVSVHDDGTGLAPRPDSPGAGLGIPLMTSLADHVEIDTTAGTRVLMSFGHRHPEESGRGTATRFGRDRQPVPAAPLVA